MTAPRLSAIATAVPPHVVRQADVIERAMRIFDRERTDIERLMPVYANAGIDTRHFCLPIEWYERDHGWAERNALYVENALVLLAEAASRCLEQAGRTFADIDAIVTVSTTGISTPSLDALLMERLPFRRDLMRLPVFGLGCAGGVLGLARAAAIARAQPGCRVLFLVVELCSLTFRKMDQSKSNIVGTALFGDGAAAALIESEADGPALAAWGEHTWPDSLDVMGWHITDDGLGVLFSRDIPALVRNQFRDAADRFLESRGLGIGDIDAFVCHPGGAKVVNALEEAFALPAGALNDAREVLREYGNMSAATVLFVLERMLERRSAPLPHDRARSRFYGGLPDAGARGVTAAQLVIGYVLLQRLLELLWAQRNTRRLLDQGAVEHGAGHYPYFVLLHASWLVAIVFAADSGAAPNWFWLATYAVLQIARLWTMASLGRFWTTRIITPAGEPLVARGPYRYLRHPNYVIVAGEIAVLPLVFDLWLVAVLFSVANAILLRERIAQENEALAGRPLRSSDS